MFLKLLYNEQLMDTNMFDIQYIQKDLYVDMVKKKRKNWSRLLLQASYSILKVTKASKITEYSTMKYHFISLVSSEAHA